MIVRQASIFDLEELTPIFDAYRIFYGQPSDISAAKKFLEDRLKNLDSVIFIVHNFAGFVQLYPSFSSISMQPIWILNDLFVAREYRKQGLAQALIEHAIKFGKKTGAHSLVLETAVDNYTAQKLYKKMGWQKEEGFLSYSFDLQKTT